MARSHYYADEETEEDTYFKQRQEDKDLALGQIRGIEGHYRGKTDNLLSSLGDCAKLLERASHSHKMQESSRRGLLGDIDDWFMANQLGRYKDRHSGSHETI
jgi:hypothetical protein